MSEEEALRQAQEAARSLAPLIAAYRAALIEAGLSPAEVVPLLVDFQKLFVTRSVGAAHDEGQIARVGQLLRVTPPQVGLHVLKFLVLRSVVPASTVEAVVREVVRGRL